MKNITMLINPNDRISHINKEIYGHFAEHLGRCIYDGVYVGEDSPIPNTRGIRNDVIEALKALKVPVIRWPGGCYADTYNWRDGIGPKELRKHILNIHWGGVTEDNSFGTHEFFDLCELVGAKPYLAGNLGSGSAKDLEEWIEYITFDGNSPMADLRRKNGREKPWKLEYVGIGNESWGCGGNMLPEHYAGEYRRYASFCRDFGDNHLYKVACGGELEWNEILLKKLKSNIDPNLAKAITLHYYTILGSDFAHKGSATDFTDKEYYEGISKTQWIEHVITQNSELLDLNDPDKKMGLIVDEWGCWYDVEPGTNPGFLFQQNTLRDAIIAAVYLNIFNNHSDRVVMANLAQMVNVLQAILLTEGDKLVKTPTYHVMDMFKAHMDNTLVYSHVDNETENGAVCISKSVSVDDDGHIHMTIANTSLEKEYALNCVIPGFEAKSVTATILNGDIHECNTFDNPNKVAIKDHTAQISKAGVSVVLPKASVVYMEIA